MNHLEDNLSLTHNTLGEYIANQIRQHVNDEDWRWLTDQVRRVTTDPQPQLLAWVFTTIHRNVTSIDQAPHLSFETDEVIGRNQLPLMAKNWPLVNLIRVWILINIPSQDETAYVSLIERLFKYGEMEELAALYAALPIYDYPEIWRQRCMEGIRSNMGPVRQAVMIHNHYPAQFLDEGAWNQMVLKAFFTDENIPNIIGLEKRNNSQLAQALVDYAYERHVAKRDVNPMLWILVSPFMDARAFALMKQIIEEYEQPLTRKAIAFAFVRSNYELATEFLKRNSGLMDLLDAADTPWKDWRGQAI